MSNPVSFVQWITHIFPNFASLKFNALFFPFLGHSLDLMGKMKQHIQRPIWLPCNPVDLSSISKQKLCFLKKKSMLEIFLFKTTLRRELYHVPLQILFGASIYLFLVPLVPAYKQERPKSTMTLPFPTDMAHIPLHPHTCYSLS